MVAAMARPAIPLFKSLHRRPVTVAAIRTSLSAAMVSSTAHKLHYSKTNLSDSCVEWLAERECEKDLSEIYDLYTCSVPPILI